MSIGPDIVVLGAIQGLLYGALAIGIVLVYRAQRFVNFAQANLGLLSSVLLSKMVLDLGVPYLVALPVALAAGALLAVAVELTVVRRLFTAPRLVLMVGSIFLAQLLLIPRLVKSINPAQDTIVTQGYPTPFDASVTVGSLVVNAPDLLIVAVVPLVVVALALFLRLSPYGQAIRAAADNPEAARLAGISVTRMSTLVWLIAGLLSAVTAILNAPKVGTFVLGGTGASVLVRALAAGLIGRMTSLPLAFGAGIGIGVVEAVTFAHYSGGGVVELVIFLIVMAALLLRSRELSRATRDAAGAINFGAEPRALPRAVAALPGVRRLALAGGLGSVALAVALPLLPVAGLNTSAKTFLLTAVTVYCLVGLSLCLLTGWGGQVSLGQFALVGVGAFAASRLTTLVDVPVALVLPAAGLVGALVALLVGLPAVRIQGLFLAVSTLAFAVLAQGFVFQQEFFVGTPGGVFIERPGLLRSDRAVYYLGLGLVVAATLLVRNVRASAPGRMLLAVRDNDRAARSDGISATGTRLVAFALAGFLCAVAGVVYAYAYQRYVSTNFGPDQSFTMVTMAVIGGLGSLPGALLGPVFVFGLPVLFYGQETSQLVQFLVGGGGGLLVLMFFPRGLAGVVYDTRDVLVARIVARATGQPRARRSGPALRDLWAAARGHRPATPERPLRAPQLVASGDRP
jgi:ABC-type branched-subunit amino acid transport system permease subunit